jgi:hypothetical protein
VRSISVDFVCCDACANRLRSVSSPPRGFGVWLCKAYTLGGYGVVGSPGCGIGLVCWEELGLQAIFFFVLYFFVLQKKKPVCCCASFSNDGSLQKLAYATVSSQHTVFFSKR